MMVDTLMKPLCTHSLSVACVTLTQQSDTDVRRNWAKLSKKAGFHDVICGSPINCGQQTMDTKLQRRPAWTHVQGWGLNILVGDIFHKTNATLPLIFFFYFLFTGCLWIQCVVFLLMLNHHLPPFSDLYLMHWPESLRPGGSNREMRAETWRALEELNEEGCLWVPPFWK